MTDYKSLFEYYKSKWETDVIRISVESKERIKEIDPAYIYGGTLAKFTSEGLLIEIVIDDQLGWEMKLRIMSHEYGHALHYASINVAEAALQMENDKIGYISEMEYAATLFELTFSKAMCELGDKQFLINTMSTITQKENADLPGFNEASQKLQRQPIWGECNELIKK